MSSPGKPGQKFAEVCRAYSTVSKTPPSCRIFHITLPYEFYTDADIAHRIVYVEASRGCPFTCEFCLSSLDVPVRAVPLEKFLGDMQKLLDRGLKQFKFVDRTFNLNIATSKAILEFFLARHQPGNFYHFEMIPDRLPAELRGIVYIFPRACCNSRSASRRLTRRSATTSAAGKTMTGWRTILIICGTKPVFIFTPI